jgi:hypothetical protein
MQCAQNFGREPCWRITLRHKDIKLCFEEIHYNDWNGMEYNK